MTALGDEQGKGIAETENYMAWEVRDPDGETTWHLELGVVSLHFFREEWDEFLQLMKDAANNSQ